MRLKKTGGGAMGKRHLIQFSSPFCSLPVLSSYVGPQTLFSVRPSGWGVLLIGRIHDNFKKKNCLCSWIKKIL